MREIKFRVWHKINNFDDHGGGGEWVDDILIDTSGNYYETDWYEFWGDDRKLVLCQYTGLNDKNGKEIYEGDIVQYEGAWPGQIYRHPVICCSGYWSPLVEVEDGHNEIDQYYPNRFEVIGNIYENPELLDKSNV